MKKKEERNRNNELPNYKTDALHSHFYEEGKARVPIPFEESVEEAKEWVDYHQF